VMDRRPADEHVGAGPRVILAAEMLSRRESPQFLRRWVYA
jgi:hypothetical protein